MYYSGIDVAEKAGASPVTTIVIHAGMPKAGSSSVQQWLKTSAAALRERAFTVAVSRWNEAEEVVFSPYEGGKVTSDWIVVQEEDEPAAWQRRADAFVAGLASSADRHGNIVVSSEGFSGIFFGKWPSALTGLQQLATRYDVRVAYYARPQHTSLEAAWRQWGFRGELSPSACIERYAAFLHHASTVRAVQRLAPDVEFEPRPFRMDLLDSGDVVADFALRFLGIEVDEIPEPANRGLPLEVVNALRAAPPGMFWDSPHDNGRVERIKRLYVGKPLPEDERIALSRQVLRKYAYDRFASDNAELGWNDFILPPDDGGRIPGLDALDELWEPRASPAELSILFGALRAAIED